jgi:alpha-glucosidase
VTLDFLDADRTYTAQIYRDGDDASWQSQPHSIAIETRKARRGDSLVLKLASGGGQAIRFIAGARH